VIIGCKKLCLKRVFEAKLRSSSTGALEDPNADVKCTVEHMARMHTARAGVLVLIRILIILLESYESVNYL